MTATDPSGEYERLRERLALAVAASFGSEKPTSADRGAVDAVLDALAVCGYRLVPYGDVEPLCGTVIGHQHGKPVMCGAIESIHGDALGMIGGHAFDASHPGGHQEADHV